MTLAVISDTPERLAALRAVLEDFRAAANISELRLRAAGEFSLEVELGDE